MSPGESGRACRTPPARGRRRSSAVAAQLETGGKLLQFERDAESALDGLFARDDHPQQHARAPRDRSFNPKCRNGQIGMVTHGRASGVPRALAPRPLKQQRLEPDAAARPGRARARSARQTPARSMPVSSDTTIATASFSSVSPMAAR